MYNSEKEYNPSVLEELEKAERAEHEEEMKKAYIRLENTKRRRKKTLFCALAGVIVGILYVIYVAMGLEWADRFLSSISRGNGIVRFILDFAPPAIVSGIAAWFIAKGEKGIFSYILTSVFAFMIVTLVFLVYLSLMMM